MKVTKWSTHSGECAVSEQTEQTSGETGSTGAAPIVPNSSISTSPDAAAASPAPVNADAASLVPDQNAADAAPEVSEPKPETAQEAAKEIGKETVKDTVKETVKDTMKPETPKPTGKLLIMSAADRGWNHDDAGTQAQSDPGQGMFGKRRLAALAAVVALAALAGALGGAMATASLQHFASNDAAVAPSGNSGLETSVARIDADVVALKAGVEHTSKMGMSQFNKTSDRLDKLEKAQAESSAKLAKLGEAVEKPHVTPPATPVAAATPQAAKEVTGTITPPAPAQTATATASKADAKPEVGRLPVIDSWVLQDVSRGGALIEGRQGVYEVYAGDVVPGLGRIDAVRRQDGRWVVVTSRGLIVAR
jgi:hypothetical protein